MKPKTRLLTCFSALCLLTTLILPGRAAIQAAPPAAETTLADLLNTDGTLRLDGTFSGALALDGWQVQLDPARGPRFAPAVAPNADPQWNALGEAPDGALRNYVITLAVSGTDVYVGGGFTDAAGIPEADYVAKWNGSAWSALGSNGAGNGALDSYVYALAVSGTNLYVGGQFNNTAGIPEADYVAKWDGSAWSALGNNGAGDGALNSGVNTLAVSGTNVYVGGWFSNAASIPEADYVAKWDGSAWSALGSNGAGDGALNNAANTLAASGTDVYVGGWFTDAAGIPEADYVAKWNGTTWSALGSNGAGDGALNNATHTLAVSGTDVYVGGQFNNTAGIPEADYVAKWDGSAWSALGSNGAGDGAVSSVVLALAVSGTDVYVGGWFSNAAGIPEADSVAKWDGSAWSALGNNGAGNGALGNLVYALAISGTDLYVGGGFTNAAGSAETDYVATWNGATWNALGGASNGALSNMINALAISGTDVYVGGWFTNAAGIPEADYVAKWNGTTWSALGSNGAGDGALNSGVNTLAVSGTELYVGGNFIDAAGSAEADYVARWNGSAWSALGNNGAGDGALDNQVYALAVSGTDVYVGGNFIDAAGSAEADHVARWNGTTWSALGNNGAGDGALNGRVYALAVSGTDVYVGGDFIDAAGASEADYVAKWNGSAWSALGSNGAGDGALDNTVYAIAVSGTDMYVGGWFANAAGSAEADYVAKWDGSAWSALGSNGAGDGAVSSVVLALVVSGADVYVGGWLGNTAGIPEADSVAKWDGSAWSALGDNGAGDGALNGTINALAISGADLYVSGEFSNAAGIPEADSVARWGVPAPCTASAGSWSDPATWSCGHVPGPGQGVIIPPGVTITLDQDVELTGDLDVQGTLDPNGKTVTLSGDAHQTLTGNPLTFYRLVLDKTNKTDIVTVVGRLNVSDRLTITKGKLESASDHGDILIETDGVFELNSDITVSGDFTNSGEFHANGYGVIFGGAVTQHLAVNVFTWFDNLTVETGTTLIESVSDDNVLVQGTLTNNGVIRKTQAIGGTGFFNFGIAGGFNGADLAIEVTSDNFSDITVSWYEHDHPNASATAGLDRYWNITPTGSGEVNLTLPHDVSPDVKASICRDTLSRWACGRSFSTNTTVTLFEVTTFSDWSVGDDAPLGATLAGFDAQQQGAAILVNWETVSEIGNLGFNLWRGISPTAPDLLLNSALIPSAAPGSSQGFSYEWLDSADLVSGNTYYYWLEDVDSSGAVTRHGPVSAAFNNAPTAVRLTGAGSGSAPFSPVSAIAIIALSAAAWMMKRRRPIVANRQD